MRLIDADKLKQDDEVTLWLSRDTVRTGKMLKTFSELFIKKIDDAPTVQAIQFEIFDEIKAEIKGKYRIILKGTPKDDWAVRWNDCLDEVLQIIDKYRESEEV